mmetsp:Transcript_25237/g.53150  ORF Transcript_25237/g.53150 Transcript_25237/m.53150 type:complete len:211 (+) Transcript_25237:206-838(+)
MPRPGDRNRVDAPGTFRLRPGPDGAASPLGVPRQKRRKHRTPLAAHLRCHFSGGLRNVPGMPDPEPATLSQGSPSSRTGLEISGKGPRVQHIDRIHQLLPWWQSNPAVLPGPEPGWEAHPYQRQHQHQLQCGNHKTREPPFYQQQFHGIGTCRPHDLTGAVSTNIGPGISHEETRLPRYRQTAVRRGVLPIAESNLAGTVNFKAILATVA